MFAPLRQSLPRSLVLHTHDWSRERHPLVRKIAANDQVPILRRLYPRPPWVHPLK
ncbi:hypothetical protein THIOM_000291 [Candidatus Thiomargarita nelsonii]|uniref:Uncharacterized protein n=1 Tax=Candidatus Thiomargarita nelsonii TaxID=1003181 RepID=A0A176S7J4_9GAMM|nr:hypothetical protein THIOM_000291 [Candidatus Thiomargarita nelsonii]